LRTENLQAAGRTLGSLYKAPASDRMAGETVPQTVPQLLESALNGVTVRVDK